MSESKRKNYRNAWTLAGLKKPKPNAPRVFSTFACGGGSSMGYKLAGFDVIGANDIDPEMMAVYRKNLERSGGLYLICPVSEVPAKGLEGLDILDGSPPCSTFSVAGTRDKTWGKKKKFREGQAEQTLDMLFFDFIDLAKRIRPKVIVAENVKGMTLGKARPYCQAVVNAITRAGYDVQIAVLNAVEHGVPQWRERVFFVARRKDLKLKPLIWPARKAVITAGDACAGITDGKDVSTLNPKSQTGRAWDKCPPGMRLPEGSGGIATRNTTAKLSPNFPSRVIPATESLFHWSEPRYMSAGELTRLSGFPDDYDYLEGKKAKHTKASYIVGMSVPPPLMKAVAGAIMDQWFGNCAKKIGTP